jgi:hypothetical protein
MTSRFKLAAPLVAVVAMLAFASTAPAKGDGGGDKTCATLNSFTNTPGHGVDSASVTTSYSVFNGCVDERMSAIAIDFRNESTGFVGRAVVMASYGLNDKTTVWRASYSTRYVITITVYAPNGKVQGTRSQRITTPDAPTA